MSSEVLLKELPRSEQSDPRYKVGDFCSASAFCTVTLVAVHASALTSTPRANTSSLPRMALALAARKEMTTPDPVPISMTNGDEVCCGKRSLSHADSVSFDNVSRSKNESSAGS